MINFNRFLISSAVATIVAMTAMWANAATRCDAYESDCTIAPLANGRRGEQVRECKVTVACSADKTAAQAKQCKVVHINGVAVIACF